MSGLKLTIILPTKHRISVKVSSKETLIRQVLEDACEKKKLDPDAHRLQRNNKVLDNSLSIRYANIPNLGELELVEIDKKLLEKDNCKPIKLAIQPEGGARIVTEFSSDTPLSDIIESIETKGHDGKKKSVGEVPVVVYMRKEITGDDLGQTTLKSLGLTGGMSAALRYFYKPPEVLHGQASVFTPAAVSSIKTEEKLHRPMRKNNEVTLSDILPKHTEQQSSTSEADKPESYKYTNSEVTKTTLKDSKSNHDSSYDEAKSQSSQNFNESSNVIMNNEDADNPKEKVPIPEIIHYLDSFIPDADKKQRNSIIFRMEDRVSMRDLDDNISDDFFELNIKDIKLLHAENVKNVKEIEEGAQLLTRQLRESQAEGNKLMLMNKYKKCIIRIQFPPPDRLVLQGTFTVTETIEDVITFVLNFIQDSDSPVHLFTTPPKNILNSKASLIDENCFPSAILHFGQEKKEADNNQDVTEIRYLKPELLTLLSNSTGVERSLVDCGIRKKVKEPSSVFQTNTGKASSNTITNVQSTSTKNGSGIKRNGSENSNHSLTPGSKVPKWFKPGKPNL